MGAVRRLVAALVAVAAMLMVAAAPAAAANFPVKIFAPTMNEYIYRCEWVYHGVAWRYSYDRWLPDMGVCVVQR